ncbi:MAG: type VI secretion system protein TssA [Candidatus Desantisbacteria bacterium]
MSIEDYALPISDEFPCGKDMSYEPEYLDIKNEIQKLTAMSSAQDKINWGTVVEISKEILGKKSKDLNIAGYLCLGLFMREGYPGIKDGLTIYCSLLEKFWDGLFPQRQKARGSAIEFLNQRVGNAIEHRDVSKESSVIIQDISELADKLLLLIQERFENPTPSLATLRSALTKQREALPQLPEVLPPEVLSPQSTLEPVEKPSIQNTQVESPVVPVIKPVIQSPTSQTEFIDIIRQMITPFRGISQMNPLPYRLLRCIKWDIVIVPPPADGEGKTKIPAPRSQVSSSLKDMAKAGNWQGLVDASEGAFQDASGTYWLDLQRMTHTGLVLLGYAQAAKAVITETASFLDRFSQIPGLSFSDGTNFADEETNQWISTQVVSLDQSQLQVEAVSNEKDDKDLQDAFELIKQKNLFGALEILQQGINRQASYTGKFIRRLTAGKYCLQFGKLEWAKALLEGLEEEITSISLEKWDPITCVEVWAALHQCYQKMLSSKQISDKNIIIQSEERICHKLFQYDIKSAIGK